MTMTRRHFDAIAAILANERHRAPHTVERIANDMCAQFVTYNSAFNRARFLGSVGVKDLAATPDIEVITSARAQMLVSLDRERVL
jgi:hypothetical protein